MVDEVTLVLHNLYNVFWFDFNENFLSYNFYFVEANYLSLLHSA